MSHFAVLVIGDNIEKQLEKFDENIEMKPYVKYTKEQAIEKELLDYCHLDTYAMVRLWLAFTGSAFKV